MGTKLSLAPVFYALAQVKFNPVVQMGEFVPRLQEALRRLNYLDFSFSEQPIISIILGGDGSPQVETAKGQQWHFFNSAKTSGFALSLDSLCFHTTEYTTFQEFLGLTITGLRALHEIVGLGYVDRVGLRYLDAIPHYDRHLKASLQGLSDESMGTLKSHFGVTTLKREGGTLMVRVFISPAGGVPFPPDLQPLIMQLQERFRGITGGCAVLDTDFSISGRVDFSLDIASELLCACNAQVGPAFKMCVTAQALEDWK